MYWKCYCMFQIFCSFITIASHKENMYSYFTKIRHRRGGSVVERSPRSEVWSTVETDLKSLEHVVTVPLPMARQQVRSAFVTGLWKWPLKTDYLCHHRYGTIKNPHRSMALSAEYIDQNLQPFTGNVDVSICWKVLEWDHKQTNIIRIRQI